MTAVTSYARMSPRELAASLPADPAAIEVLQLEAKAVCHKLSIARWASVGLSVAAFVGLAVVTHPDNREPGFFAELFLVSLGVTVVCSLIFAAIFDGCLADKYDVLQHRLTPLCNSSFYMGHALEMLRKCPSALAYRSSCLEKGRQLYFVDADVIKELLEAERQSIADAERKALCQQLHRDDLSAAPTQPAN